MTDEGWAEKDYSYNTTRKKVIGTLSKMDKELDLMSSISSAERMSIKMAIDYITCRLELAKVNYERLKEGDEK